MNSGDHAERWETTTRRHFWPSHCWRRCRTRCFWVLLTLYSSHCPLSLRSAGLSRLSRLVAHGSGRLCKVIGCQAPQQPTARRACWRNVIARLERPSWAASDSLRPVHSSAVHLYLFRLFLFPHPLFFFFALFLFLLFSLSFSLFFFFWLPSIAFCL